MDLLSINGGAWLLWLVYWFVAARFVKATKSSEGILSRLRHILPLSLGFYLIFYGGRSALLGGRLYSLPSVRWTGMVLTLIGLLFSVWARIHLGQYWSGIITLKEGHQLIRSGPYQWVRHPLYTGFLTAAVGSALVAATLDGFVGCALIVIAIVFKLRCEETLLTSEFGDEYRQFQREVPALVPFVV